MGKLQAQLKASAHSSKGGQMESDRLKKDLDKTRWAACALPQPCLSMGPTHAWLICGLKRAWLPAHTSHQPSSRMGTHGRSLSCWTA